MKTIYQLNHYIYQCGEYVKTIAVSSDREKLEELYDEEYQRAYEEVEVYGDSNDYDQWAPLEYVGDLLNAEQKSEQKPWRSDTNHHVIEEVEYLD